MHRSLPKRLVTLCCILALGLLPSCSHTKRDSLAGGGTIDQNGGTVSVTSGPLAGTVITLPAGAVTGAVAVEIRESYRKDLLGFDAVGPGTHLAPTGLGLQVGGTAQLVFDPTLVPAGAVASDFVVFRETSQGRRIELAPNSVDMVAGTVVVGFFEFASYWVAVQVRDLDYLLADFWPLIDGDVYSFDNDIVMAVENTVKEPNLEGLFVSKVSFTRDGEGFGSYFNRDFIGNFFVETLFLGGFATDDSVQEIVSRPHLWLGDTGVVGSNFTGRSFLARFEPLGSPLPVEVVDFTTSVTIASDGSLDTPMGRFSEVLEVQFFSEREDSLGRVSTTLDTLWLARGVGPVQIQLQGVTNGKGRLIAGLVDREPIAPR